MMLVLHAGSTIHVHHATHTQGRPNAQAPRPQQIPTPAHTRHAAGPCRRLRCSLTPQLRTREALTQHQTTTFYGIVPPPSLLTAVAPLTNTKVCASEMGKEDLSKALRGRYGGYAARSKTTEPA